MWLVMTPEVCQRTSSSLTAINTIFGWTFQGATTTARNNSIPKCMVCILPSSMDPQNDHLDNKRKQCKNWDLRGTPIEPTQDTNKTSSTVFYDSKQNVLRPEEQWGIETRSTTRKCPTFSSGPMEARDPTNADGHAYILMGP